MKFCLALILGATAFFELIVPSLLFIILMTFETYFLLKWIDEDVNKGDKR